MVGSYERDRLISHDPSEMNLQESAAATYKGRAIVTHIAKSVNQEDLSSACQFEILDGAEPTQDFEQR